MSQPKVLITGAGSGLGRALALRYARDGYAVACADLVPERAQETLALLPGAGHHALRVDVGDDASVDALRASLEHVWDSIDVVVNNAGVASGGSILEADMAEWQWMLNINLLGVVRGCRAFVPWLVRQKRGRVINIASFAALAGAPNIMSYGVAKAGVYSLSDQLRAELYAKGVEVSVVCPSFFKTNLCENFRSSDGGKMKHVATKLMEQATVSATDIANAIVDQSNAGTFLILPTAVERTGWRLKRWFPKLYFRRLLKMSNIHVKPARG